MMRYLTLALASLCLLSLTACQKDAITANRISGEWAFTTFTITDGDKEIDILSSPDYTATGRLKLMSNGNFTLILNSENFDLNFNGIWTLDQEWLSLEYEDEDGIIGSYLSNLTVPLETYRVAALSTNRLAMTGIVGGADIVIISEK